MAEWDAAYINDLPDSAFACIDAGGDKDADGKTTPRSLRHYPHHDAGGKVDAPHLANARARVEQQGTTSCGYDHLFEEHALPSDEARSMPEEEVPPRDYVVRAQFGEAASVAEGESQPVLRGFLGNFEEWVAVDNHTEGRFVERILPGAFKRTIEHNRSRLRVIYDHGLDPRFGRAPLGPLTDLREGERGAEYEVDLLDTSYNRDLIPGLRAGMYGSSYRFRTVRMDRVPRPPASDHNPERWEERSIRELEMVELGPTPFPVYASTFAGLRSMTDEFRSRQLGIDPEQLPDLHPALPDDGPAAASDDSTRGVGAPIQPDPRRFRSREEYLQWLSKISTH